MRSAGFSVDTRLLEGGQPSFAISELVQRERFDVVAMATHGRSGLSRALLGSVADEVVRNVSVPVLLYRPTEI
jgi:nucleotide-binding universal stress UspA family protein